MRGFNNRKVMQVEEQGKFAKIIVTFGTVKLLDLGF